MPELVQTEVSRQVYEAAWRAEEVLSRILADSKISSYPLRLDQRQAMAEARDALKAALP